MSARQSMRVDAAGIEIAVHREGSPAGPPVIVLHGFTGDSESMRSVTDALRADFDVVCIDLVGHGESSAPRDTAPYTMAACLEQLLAVCEELGLSRAHWIGYSMGGRTALSLAASAPDRVASLLLVGASAGLADADQRAARIASDEALADRIEGAGLEAFVDDWMVLPLFASQKRLGPEALARARTQRLRNRAHGLANSLRGMGSGAMPPLHARLASIACPVAFVVGDEDAKFRELAAAYEALMPHAETRLVREAGHAAHLEQPAAFGAFARDFLARAAAAPTDLRKK